MSDYTAQQPSAAVPAPQPIPAPQPTQDTPSPATPLVHASGVEPVSTGLTLVAYRLADQGAWSFGVDLGGTYVELARKKLGGIDDDLREVATPGYKAWAASGFEGPPPTPSVHPTA